MNKTAILSVYTLYGTTNSVSVDVMYRKRVLYSFAGHKAETGELLQKAIQWAMNQGYQSTKAEWVKTC